ncbi:hypothetical protein CRM22_000499 [Opisthorchis felineus]|uniref:Major facilitator superfamily (MFS) profile domain-containing protein n=1 Tax=Opisthorchis felineus TaxID=147828 RepID=A0A4S2MF18_OPIFE|nr:hypothetical protein CRM22_000499 [Opisthorchis felineus]
MESFEDRIPIVDNDSISNTSDDPHSRASISVQNNYIHRVYPVRWAIVLVLAFINGTNAYIWISYAPVANHFSEYYSTTEYVLNWMQLVFPITTVLFGLPASLVVDWLGIRFVLLFSATTHLICGLARLLSSCSTQWPSTSIRLGLVLFGHVVASLAQPLCMFAPTKLALDWFPDFQRATANTIGSLGNSVGVLVGSALVPFLVPQPSAIPTFNYITMGLVTFGGIVSVLFVRKNKPETSPSVASTVLEEMHRKHAVTIAMRLQSFVRCVGLAMKSPAFLLLATTFGGGLAYFGTISTLLQQILCTKGYSNEYAGICGSLLIVAGLIASAPCAIYVDRTGRLVESVKVCFVLATLGCVGFSVVIWFPGQSFLTIFFTMWLGAFGFAQYSLALELAAEITFPVPEAITTGLMISFSQILSIVFVAGMQAAAPEVHSSPSFTPTCGSAVTPQDYTVPNLVVCSTLVLVGIIQLFALRVTYKRREASLSFNSQVDAPPNHVSPVTDEMGC